MLIHASVEMSWNHRCFNSPSGAVHLIGANNGNLLGTVCLSKLCAKCDLAEKKCTEPREHNCPKNYDGTSKAMDAVASVQLVINLHSKGYALNKLVMDDDSSMQAVLKHSWEVLIAAGKMDPKDWPCYDNTRRKSQIR
jgi:hypothetical protein